MIAGDRSPLLALENVSIVRDGQTLLDRLSLSVADGEHTAILGPNGSGKTTLLRLLSREWYPSWLPDGRGFVRILGRDDWHVRELRQQLGIVAADLDRTFARGRSGRMTAREAVATGFTAAELAERGPDRTDETEAAIDDALAAVVATSLADRTLQTLSTGERRRVLIARALVHRPRLLVLDEPTAGLDIAARRRLLELLEDRLPSLGATIVLVTHHIEEILPAIGRCVLLHEGRVVFDGTRHEALTSERLSNLFGVPVRVSEATGIAR